MSLAEFLVFVRARAGNVAPTESVDDALATLIGLGGAPGPEGQTLRKIFSALTQSHTTPEFEMSEVRIMGPVVLGALDCVLQGMLDGRCSDRKLREALRPLLVRAVK